VFTSGLLSLFRKTGAPALRKELCGKYSQHKVNLEPTTLLYETDTKQDGHFPQR